MASPGVKSCLDCAGEFPLDRFVTAGGKNSPCCRECRIAFIRKQETLRGTKVCAECSNERPLATFVGRNGPCRSCADCRVQWAKAQEAMRDAPYAVPAAVLRSGAMSVPAVPAGLP